MDSHGFRVDPAHCTRNASLPSTNRLRDPSATMWPTVAPSPTAPCSQAGTHHQPAPIVTAACAIPGALPQQPRAQRRGQAPAAALQRAARRPPAPASSPPRPQRKLEQRRQRAARLPACAAAAPEAAEGGYETDNDGQTVEQRLTLVQNMVATVEQLIPYDASAVNMALILWGAIRNIPAKDRVQLVSRLNSGDIKRLWQVAGQRYRAPKQQVSAAIGPEYSLWKDLPASPTQLSHFRGKAALPTHVLGVSRFSKAFFLQPDSEALYGRVLLGKGPLGDALYPLYFKAAVGTAVVPTTQELCDLTLQYLPPQQLGLGRDDVPRSRWPPPRRQLPPFHDGFTDYLRAVAPGVYVGLGYRTASTEPSDPLYFLMVHTHTESLL